MARIDLGRNMSKSVLSALYVSKVLPSCFDVVAYVSPTCPTLLGHQDKSPESMDWLSQTPEREMLSSGRTIRKARLTKSIDDRITTKYSKSGRGGLRRASR